MTDDLFPMPANTISPLDAARVRLGLAEAEYKRHDLANEGFGDQMPSVVVREYRTAAREVGRLEALEIAKRKQP